MADAPNAWRATALAFELRAMRVEYVIRLLVAAGHVSQEKVDEAFSIAKNYAHASIGDTPAPQSTEGGEERFIGGAAGEATYGVAIPRGGEQ